MTESVKELNSLPRKFMFDERHDEGEAQKEELRKQHEEAKAQAKQQKALAKAEELEAARQEGYAQGRQQGFAEGYTQGFADVQPQILEAAKGHADTLAAQALQAIAQRMALAQQISEAGVENTQRMAVSVAIAVSRKLAEKALDGMPDAAIEAMVADVLAGTELDKKLMLKVNPLVIESLTPKLEIMAQEAGFSGTIEIRGDSSIMPFDGRLTWAEGGAQRVFDHVLAQMEDVIARHFNTDQLSDADVEVPGFAAPEGHEDIAVPPAPDFIFTGEPAIPALPLEPQPTGPIPQPASDQTSEPTPEMVGTPADMPHDATPHQPESATPDTSDPEQTPADEEAHPLEEVDFNAAPKGGSGEQVGFMKTGRFEIGEFSDKIEPAKKQQFEGIGMDQFERLDDE